jgi:multiple sugar transport system permease protein
LIYIDSEELFTLPLIINTFRTEYSIQWGLLMAASAVSVIPMIIIYLFAQKSFVEGIATTGIKG